MNDGRRLKSGGLRLGLRIDIRPDEIAGCLIPAKEGTGGMMVWN